MDVLVARRREGEEQKSDTRDRNGVRNKVPG
jgi:hypothetical protein